LTLVERASQTPSMAQTSGSGGAAERAEGFRQRHHRQRRREFLDTALAIVTSEGLQALTMQRVTEELQCSVGSIYHYFPSKGSLLAALEGEALAALGRSLVAGQANLDRRLQQQADPLLDALARPLAAARFWIAAEDAFPLEVELLRRQLTAPGILVALDEGLPAFDAALTLITLGQGLLDGAVEAGALQPGANLDRAMIMVAGTTGVLMTTGVRCRDAEVASGQHLAREMVGDLLVAWGARPDVLDRASALVDELAAAGDLTPVVADVEPVRAGPPGRRLEDAQRRAGSP
jgi:AcrR family transcriptional regulator